MPFIALLVALIIGWAPAVEAQDDLAVLSGWRRYSDVRNALYNSIAAEAYSFLDARDRRIEGLRTEAQWRSYITDARAGLASAFGPLPDKTPLNASVTGSFVHDGIAVENIRFESRPGFHVTAAMFRRADLAGQKLPVVIYVCGHTADGYRSEAYQQVMLNLAKKGIAVLGVDPVGQGERLQYVNPETGRSVIGGPTSEHSYAGLQYLLVGRTLAMVRLWDCMRAVDYLISRPDIDAAKIGVHGRSGGGTMSAYLGAMDDRITAAAPECYLTSFRRLFQSIGPQDAEQNLLAQISSGLDHGDFILARAPKPTLLAATTRDFFSIQGVRETSRSVKPAFEALGAGDSFAHIEDDAPHQSTKLNRERVYAFFMKSFAVTGSAADETVPFIDPSKLQVTSTGQVTTSGSKSIHDIILDDAGPVMKALSEKRSRPVSERKRATTEAALKLSGYHAADTPSEAIFTGRIRRDGYAVEKYIINPDNSLPIPALLFVPDGGGRHPAVLYCSSAGKSADAGERGFAEAMVRSGWMVLTCDLPGYGEMTIDTHNDDSVIRGVSYNLVFGAQLIGHSITGIQAGCVSRAAKFLASRDDARQGMIAVVSRGTAGPAVMHAAALDTAIGAAAFIETPVSWESVIRHRYYDQSIGSTIVPGALNHYDLPDLAGVIAPRKTIVVDPLGGDAKPLNASDTTALESLVRPFHTSGEGFAIERTIAGSNPETVIVRWLGTLN